MDLTKLKVINDKCVNVVIEIPFGVTGAKYELDAESGCIMLDRIFKTPMHYPCSYGLIPNTKGGDGDPLDAVLVCSTSLHIGVVVPARPVGVLIMEDEKGQDEKILCIADCDLLFEKVRDYTDIPLYTQQLEYFFARYKDLDSAKWSKVVGWKGSDKAWDIIRAAI